MAWVTPSGRSTGDIVTAAIWNQDVVDNPRYLKGLDGNVQIEDRVAFDDDAAFYAEIVSSNPVINLASGDYLEYDRASNLLKLLIASTLEATLRATGLLLASGNYIEVGSGDYALWTDEGSTKKIAWGSDSHVHTAGQEESRQITTGFSQLDSFACSLDVAGAGASINKVNILSGGAGGLVDVYHYTPNSETCVINWIAVGDL